MADEWSAFGKSLSKVAAGVFSVLAEKHKAELGQTIVNDILDDPGPREIDRRSTERELFVRRVFEGYSELFASLESLRHTEIYLRRFPFSDTEITRVDYLKYHVQNYFNEVYILKERLNAFLTSLGREYRRDPRHAAILAATRPLFGSIANSLSGIVDTRGKHVHVRRYSDKDIDRLGLMSLLMLPIEGKKDEFAEILRGYSDLEYRRVRSIWRRRIKENNSALRTLLDAYAIVLSGVLLSPDRNTLLYPRNLGAT